jgi:aspartate/tyrosine/aromatic aminotransferase
MSNVPYSRMVYSLINDPGKQWIKKYALALTKELLGAVRSKYSSIPIPGADVTLDGSELRQEASTEKEALMTELKEMLEQVSRRNQLEMKKDESEFMQDVLNRVPYPIYVR